MYIRARTTPRRPSSTCLHISRFIRRGPHLSRRENPVVVSFVYDSGASSNARRRLVAPIVRHAAPRRRRHRSTALRARFLLHAATSAPFFPQIHLPSTLEIPPKSPDGNLARRRWPQHAAGGEAGGCGGARSAQGRGHAGAENRGVEVPEGDLGVGGGDGSETEGDGWTGGGGGGRADKFWPRRSCARAEWSKCIWRRYSSDVLH